MPGPAPPILSAGLPPRQVLAILLTLLLFALPSGVAGAQQDDIVIEVDNRHLGLGGVVQRGVWTPVFVELTNNSAENIEVDLRWLLADDDGDEVIAERRSITLTAQRSQSFWLYAVPPMSTRANESWVFQAVSTQSGELVARLQRPLPDQTLIEPSINLVGVCGSANLGLTPWLRWSTQHEQLRLVRNLNLEDLPDRWYGLESLSALVWYPSDRSGSPISDDMPPTAKRALREWVYRGGHLVLFLPYGDARVWTSGDSELADLIEPMTGSDVVPAQGTPPFSVFSLLTNDQDPVPIQWFDLSDRTVANAYTSLAEFKPTQIDPATTSGPGAPDADDDGSRPMIVTRRLGFGTVTLVGIDLSDPNVLGTIEPFALHRVWTRIFSWRGSKSGALLPVSEFEDDDTAGQYFEAKGAQHIELGNWLAKRVAREGEGNVGPALSLAFVLFLIYAIAVALTFPNLLRSRGWERHSWVLFVGIVALFSAMAWGGAYVIRPSSTSAAHFTVLDIDGNTNMVHARSWQSLLIPSFSTADIEVPSDPAGLSRVDLVNLLSSPGHTLRPESPGFPDQRSYSFDTTAPGTQGVPMRSTTKSLVVDFLGAITSQQPGLQRPWSMPIASLRMEDSGLPVGTVTHQFHGPLTDVLVIYCPGGAQSTRAEGLATRPLVHARTGNWEPGQPLVLNEQTVYTPLWIQPNMNSRDREFRTEGFLGRQIAERSGTEGSGNPTNVVNDIPLLSFFDAMPPPNYETQDTGGFGTGMGMSTIYYTYSRSMVRDLDLTPLITGRRVIIIGHLRGGASPVPMTVDGQAIESDGWTVVRWIYDL